MSKENKHKKNKHKYDGGCCCHHGPIVIKAKAFIDKANEEIKAGKIIVTTGENGVPQLNISNTDTDDMSFEDNSVFECETNEILSNIILSNINDSLDGINVTLNNINFSIDKMREENENMYHLGDIYTAQAAEPIKMYPDDNLIAMVKDLIHDELSNFAEKGIMIAGNTSSDDVEEQENISDGTESHQNNTKISKFNNNVDDKFLNKVVMWIWKKQLDYVSIKGVREHYHISYDKAKRVVLMLEECEIISTQRRGSKLGRAVYHDKVLMFLRNIGIDVDHQMSPNES